MRPLGLMCGRELAGLWSLARRSPSWSPVRAPSERSGLSAKADLTRHNDEKSAAQIRYSLLDASHDQPIPGADRKFVGEPGNDDSRMGSKREPEEIGELEVRRN